MQNDKQYNIPEETPMLACEAAVAYLDIPNSARGKEYLENAKACAFTDTQLRDIVAYSMQEVAKGHYYTAEQATEHFMNI